MNKFITATLIASLLISYSSSSISAEKSEKPKTETLTRVPGSPAAPDFNLEDQNGNFVKLSDHKGKVVIVNFWATWCPPCRKEMPSMQRAWEVLRADDIEMLAINVGEDSDVIFAFTAEYPVEFPLLMDKTSSVTRQWRVRGLPSTYVVDPDGKIVYQAIGSREWDADTLIKEIQALKKE